VTEKIPENPTPPSASATGAIATRVAISAFSGAIPLPSELFTGFSGSRSEREQARINEFLHHMMEMLKAEMREKEKTIHEITARIDMQDEKISERIKSHSYQALLRKAFRDWAGTESEDKRTFVRNILTSAAASSIASDDVIKLFLEWIKDYSELHFHVIGAIYNSAGITRGGVWRKLGRQPVREDSSDADLFRLIFRDLSTGGIVRQHRETDYSGNFIAKPSRRIASAPKGTTKTLKSAFDEDEQYELTALGDQFVHYAMTDVPIKLEFQSEEKRP
jgi:hypothetical protein